MTNSSSVAKHSHSRDQQTYPPLAPARNCIIFLGMPWFLSVRYCRPAAQLAISSWAESIRTELERLAAPDQVEMLVAACKPCSEVIFHWVPSSFRHMIWKNKRVMRICFNGLGISMLLNPQICLLVIRV